MRSTDVPPLTGPIGAAVATNIVWCDLVCRAARLRPVLAADSWRAPTRTPAGYPDAITRVPGRSAVRLLSNLDASPGCSVKDSFADLDLTAAGFDVLFEAHWIHCPPAGGRPAEPTWARLEASSELAAWALAHGLDLDPDVLRDDPRVHVCRSDTGASVVLTVEDGAVGVSHVEHGSDEPGAGWTHLLAEIRCRFPAHQVVGYESGPELAAAVGAGFAVVGPLRVWLRHEPPDAQSAGTTEMS